MSRIGALPNKPGSLKIKMVPRAVFSLSIFAVFFFTTPVFSSEIRDPIIELSLKDSIQTAFLNNKSIQIQIEEIDIAKANILGARSAFWPKLSANYGYTVSGAAFDLRKLAIQGGSKKDVGIFTGYTNDNNIGISVTDTVYNGGANIAALRESQLGLKVQEETLRARKLDVAFETKRLYYGILLAYETERITQALFNEAKAHYDDVKAKFEQGTSSRFDLLQSSVQVSKIVPEVVKAGNAIQVITAEFKKLLSFEQEEPVGITGRLDFSPVEIKEEEFLKGAYKNNPEMILKLFGIDISKWEIEYAKSGYYPQVDANFGYDYRSNNLNTIFNYQHSNWALGVTVGFSIFDGMSTKAKVDAAKAKYAQAFLSREDVTDRLAVDVKRACLDMKQSEAIIRSQRDAIVEAKDALRIAIIGYDNGVTTNLDVLDTQVSLSQVEKNLSEGIYDYLMAKAQLDRVMGRETYGEEK